MTYYILLTYYIIFVYIISFLNAIYCGMHISSLSHREAPGLHPWKPPWNKARDAIQMLEERGSPKDPGISTKGGSFPWMLRWYSDTTQNFQLQVGTAFGSQFQGSVQKHVAEDAFSKQLWQYGSNIMDTCMDERNVCWSMYTWWIPYYSSQEKI